MENGVVIIGAGHAGVQAAASLREQGFAGPVTLVGDEPDLPYHKPPLSKAFIKDLSAAPQILRSEGFYAASKIDLRLGVRVAGINTAARRVELGDGGEIGFDHLILATGSRPRQLALQEGTLDGVVTLRSVADAQAIRERSQDLDDILVVGGGFIGLEVAATLAASGRRLTVIEAQDRLLGRAIAPAIAAHVFARLTASGIRIQTRAALTGFEGSGGRVVAAVLASGERIATEMVVVGIGVTPNSELAAAAGLATSNGVAVDRQLRTSIPEILAIGDVANFHLRSTGDRVRLESVQNATDHARLAARTITGHRDEYAAVPWFWSDIGAMKLQMVGLGGVIDRTVVAGSAEDNRFSLFHYGGERLLSIESVNRPADHMLGRRMIAAGYSPDPQIVAGGDLKQAFGEWQQTEPASPVAP